MNLSIVLFAIFAVFCIGVSALGVVHTSVRQIHEVEPHHDAGFWKKKWTWKARWVKTWRPKKVYVATWKRVWGPVSINEWVPYPPQHILPVPHVTHIKELPHLPHIQELPHFRR